MNKDISVLWKKLEETSGIEQQKLFVEYCEALIKLKEEGELTEEEAAYKMVGALSIDTITSVSEFNDLLDIAGQVEIPRETSYRQSMGQWNKETADALKQKEWRDLKFAFEKILAKWENYLMNAVIEIDEVEYLIDELAARMVEKDEREIALTRLIDRSILVLSAKEIKEIIKEKGIVDHLD